MKSPKLTPYASAWWLWLVRVLGAGYAIALVTSTHIPIDDWEVVTNYDKLIHLNAYVGLAIFAVLSQLPMLYPKWRRVQLGLCLLLFAAVDEITQGFVNRTPDIFDWQCDAVGIVAVLLAAQLATLYWKKLPADLLSPGSSLGGNTHETVADGMAVEQK